MEPKVVESCKSNVAIAKKLKQCNDFGVSTENLIYWSKGKRYNVSHNGGSCLMADIAEIGKFCNTKDFNYVGLNGYPTEGIPAPTIRDDGTIDYDGIEGIPVCKSLYAVSKLWNDITNVHGIGNIDLTGSGTLSKDLNGLLTLRDTCQELEIPWEECTEGKLNKIRATGLSNIIEETIQTQIKANEVAKQQTDSYNRGTAAAMKQVQAAQEANKLAAQLANVETIDSKKKIEENDEFLENNMKYIIGAGLILICCCVVMIVIIKSGGSKSSANNVR